jgi:uncharacterized protein
LLAAAPREGAVKKKIQEDLKASMKARDERRTMTLRGVLAEITRVEKDVCREASEDEIIQVLKRERARREEALEFASQAGRQDLVRQNEVEAKILDSYIPAGLTAEEVTDAIAAQIAAGTKQIGPIMKALREQFGARLDGKMASELVKQALAPKS